MDSSKGDYRTWKKKTEYINLTKYKVFSIFFLKSKDKNNYTYKKIYSNDNRK